MDSHEKQDALRVSESLSSVKKVGRKSESQAGREIDAGERNPGKKSEEVSYYNYFKTQIVSG